MSKRSQYACFWGAIGLLIAIGVVFTTVVKPGTGGTADASDGPYSVAINVGSCGTDWGGTTHVPGGEQDFEIANGSDAGIDVQLQQPSSKKVFLELESVGAHATAAARVTLAQGRYRFVCFPAEADPVVGPTVTVGAAPPGSVLTPGVVPITQNDLVPVAKTYGVWVDGRLPTLKAQVAALASDAEEGDLAAAKADWLKAHLTYETLGAAYGAFGELDTAINGTPASGTTALTDPDLTGFHKIEALLWSGAPAPQVAAAATQLVASVGRLVAEPETDRIDPLDIGLRAHEIVENAIQFEATGDTDAGSHTNLATIDANLTGATQALGVLKQLLATRYDKLAEAEASLASSQKLVEGYRQADGSWTPLQSLSATQRRQLDAALDGTVELLAPVAEIAEPRRALT